MMKDGTRESDESREVDIGGALQIQTIISTRLRRIWRVLGQRGNFSRRQGRKLTLVKRVVLLILTELLCKFPVPPKDVNMESIEMRGANICDYY